MLIHSLIKFLKMKKKKNQNDLISKAKQLTKGLKYKVLVQDRIAENHEGETILYPRLCVTDYYELFCLHNKNRIATKSHNKTMYNSVEALRKVLRPLVVVLLNGKYYIVDGQHLYNALIKFGLPIEFYLIEAKSETELIKIMRQMNSSSRRWGIHQFVKVNTSNDKRKNAYDKLQMFTDKYTHIVGMTTKVMSAIMFNETRYSENNAVRAITGDYFVQNVPDTRIKKRLDSLKRFYRTTKMTSSNYLNGAYIEMLYDKQETFFENEKEFFASIKMYVHKHNLTCYKFGTRKDAWSLLTAGWKNMKN